ncbi:MAG: hypothetical protein VB009_03310 [Erysipelotrichaceae bacterium]|nr:hypothetical protein [Erysipelotrichaceae bacterium]
MVNTTKIKAYITKANYSFVDLAVILNITVKRLENKINNKTDFYVSEIDLLCQLLSIPISERNDVFFKDIS